ncbi:FecR domain-containing protein [Chitinophaga vietnamensis]|uniref:FecR domain-containing protein n=1 Tax=Chitinophaga vietnamensis TaxID=2593957 RepID=UPI001178A898|nr:FecR domain-containing protein [Chitinophaga vietnamensis]
MLHNIMPDNIPYELLAKYFSGDASPEEAMALDDWLDASAEHRLVFSQVNALWEQASEGQRHQLPDKEAVWNSIRQQLEARPPSLKVASRYGWWWKGAAAAVIGATLAVLYYHYRPAASKQVAALPPLTVTAVDAIRRDTLPDQSLAVLQQHATLRYARGFSGKERLVELSGEAWFDVKPAANKPFMVKAGDVSIRVLGTAFNVKQEDSLVTIAVQNGRIAITNGARSLEAGAGEQVTYHVARREFDKTAAVTPASKVFNFENATLGDIARQLEKAYGVTVVLENKELANCTMSSSFENKDLHYIFQVIAVTLNVQYRIEKDHIYVNGKGCS